MGEWCDTWLEGYEHAAVVDRPAGRGAHRPHPGRVRAHAACRRCGRRTSARGRSQLAAEGLSRVLRLRPARAARADLYSDAVHDGLVRQVAVLAPHLPGRRQAAGLRGDHRAGVGAARRDARSTYGRPSCSAHSPVCGWPRRAGCGSPTSTSCAASCRPAVQYPARAAQDARRRARPCRSRSRWHSSCRRTWPAGGLRRSLTRHVGPPARARGPSSGRSGLREPRCRACLPASATTTCGTTSPRLLIASGADVKVVQARLRHASAKTTLDTYGHLWPDSDDSTRAAIEAVMAARAGSLADSLRTEGGG